MKNAVLARKTFDEIKKKFAAAGKEVSPAYLRMEAVLSNTTGKYKFDVKSLGSESPTERKLDRNDLFYVTEVLLGTILCNAGDEPKTPIKTYTPADTPDLECIYSGALQLKTGSHINFEMPMLNFKHVPQTQLNATAGTQDQFSIEHAAYSGVEDIVLDGFKSHELTLEFPTTAGLSIAGTAPLQRKAVLFLKGFIVKNGSQGVK